MISVITLKANLKAREEKAKASGQTLDGRIDSRILNEMYQKHPSITDKKGLHRQRNIYNSNSKTKRRPFPFEDKSQL